MVTLAAQGHSTRLPRPVPYLPLVTCSLIALCVVVFVIGPVSGLDPFYGSGASAACAQTLYYHRWGVIPAELLTNSPLSARLSHLHHCAPAGGLPKIPALSVLTAMFVHGGWLHLAGNMVFLFVFGAMVERRVGPLAFLLFYIALGYLATYGYALFESGSPQATQTLVGASGAIAGVLGAYLCLYPRARITSLIPLLLFLPLRFPAWLVLGFWFAVQWLSVRATDPSTPGIAYAAHLIGFTGGFAFAWLLWRGGARRIVGSVRGRVPRRARA
ncbi:rhomboid family intramembrane serine protease [Streptacidiphilus jiangxiensis]|uniref:Membrane associated serine protease, rhomboid family n=1 Tax=Streptacidiphilus jiangxiensis TaxID=235985 RepID=A0A1H7SST9_STRJI|nr:rhomboid family intramembrane serine protease [Streptacidiphilus jiangxiensis]SEL75439.1 Membrane associated serine protease, rhomboid family [Streptacidiphilus jiangxiensis]